MEERLLALLRLALKYNATDIHFMMNFQDVRIEMRIDGLCHQVKSKFEDYKLIRYLQYLANLDVGNIMTPQTGQFEMEVDGQLLSLGLTSSARSIIQTACCVSLTASLKSMWIRCPVCRCRIAISSHFCTTGAD